MRRQDTLRYAASSEAAAGTLSGTDATGASVMNVLPEKSAAGSTKSPVLSLPPKPECVRAKSIHGQNHMSYFLCD
jgi:hypothetical protein